MRLSRFRQTKGFTVGEMLVCVSVSGLLFAGIFSGSIALNRSYAASNDYFSTHMQQIRIMDYLARDVKRSFSVTTSSDLKTVTCIMPNYVVQTGDPEAADATTIGTRRTPVVVGSINKAVVDYGARGTRTLADGVTTNASPILTSATAAFTTADIGNPVTGTNIQAATTISGYTSATSVTLSKNATASGSALVFKIYGDGNRTVTDSVTTIGSPTLTSATAYFTAADIGKPVVGTAINAGTTIQAVASSTSATMSSNANASAPAMYLTIGGTVVVYTVNGNSITRTENGVLTTIASSTDQLVPQTTDWQQSNTEYTTSTVTFEPIFKTNGDLNEKARQRAGTMVYSTAYLRNKRRGN